MKRLHRNSQKRIYLSGYIYYVVVRTHNNFPYFKESIFCKVFIENLKICKKLKSFELYGFSLIYDHFNLLFKPGNKFNYSQIMQALKKNISQDINKILGVYIAGANSNSRLHKVNIEIMRQNFIDKLGANQNIYPKFQWQKSFHDYYIRGEEDYHNHYEYTVLNHLKHGLPENWHYTSLNYPQLLDYPDF